MRWKWSSFSDLDLVDLYALLQLRQEVFVVEQNCVFLDADGDDMRCHHLLGFGEDGALDACLRVYPPGGLDGHNEVVIGRVVTAARVRGQGIGRQLMLRGMAHASTTWGHGSMYLGGQTYLKAFYEGLGFVRCGPDYLEDGIPHLPMRRPATPT